MRYSEARPGRAFVVRLEDGEVLHETVERFARDHHIAAAAVILVGAADRGSRLVVGPREGRAHPIDPLTHVLEEVHEACGTGTIFPNERGEPVLHMHIAAGREGRATAGCVRAGVRIWQVAEVIILELVGTTATRRLDSGTGFELLEP